MKMALSIGGLKIISHGPNPGNIMSHLIRLFKELAFNVKNIKSLQRMGIS